MMASGRKLDIKQRELPEPKVCGIGTRSLSIAFAVLFLIDDAAQLYVMFINFYKYEGRSNIGQNEGMRV